MPPTFALVVSTTIHTRILHLHLTGSPIATSHFNTHTSAHFVQSIIPNRATPSKCRSTGATSISRARTATCATSGCYERFVHLFEIAKLQLPSSRKATARITVFQSISILGPLYQGLQGVNMPKSCIKWRSTRLTNGSVIFPAVDCPLFAV